MSIYPPLVCCTVPARSHTWCRTGGSDAEGGTARRPPWRALGSHCAPQWGVPAVAAVPEQTTKSLHKQARSIRQAVCANMQTALRIR
jgi:hypothetical protein